MRIADKYDYSAWRNAYLLQGNGDKKSILVLQTN